MINIQDKEKCCGCEACAQKCPKQCISMIEDDHGFLYPSINHDICVDCGICEKVCPVINQFDEKQPIKIYGCKNKNLDARINSSSGGFFSAFANRFIEQGGVVFGVSFNDKWEAVFSYTEDVDGLVKFRGSKYTQAFVGHAYKEAENFLKAGRKVLFSGTSCQIAGLKHYLRKEYSNLFTIDFICHGVPSQKLFREFLKEEMTKTALRAVAGKSTVSSSLNAMSLIEDIAFREKGIGWKKYRFVLTLAKPSGEGKKSSVSSSLFADTSYGKFFLSDVSLRPSCYACPAKAGKASSDLTMADYWGIQNYYPEFDDDKGVTLAIINNERILPFIPFNDLEYIEPTHEEAFANNGGYFKSVPPQPRKDEFWHLYEQGLLLENIKRMMYPVPIKSKIKRYVKHFLHIK